MLVSVATFNPNHWLLLNNFTWFFLGAPMNRMKLTLIRKHQDETAQEASLYQVILSFSLDSIH